MPGGAGAEQGGTSGPLRAMLAGAPSGLVWLESGLSLECTGERLRHAPVHCLQAPAGEGVPQQELRSESVRWMVPGGRRGAHERQRGPCNARVAMLAVLQPRYAGLRALQMAYCPRLEKERSAAVQLKEHQYGLVP